MITKAIVYDVESIKEVPKELQEQYDLYLQNSKSQFVSYPQFNKIICIGYILIEKISNDSPWQICKLNGKPIMDAIVSDDEPTIVKNFLNVLNTNNCSLFIGYNNKSYDNPIIRWKAYKYKFDIPYAFMDNYKYNLRPVYDVKLAYNDFDQYPLSLRTLCISLGIKNPKADCEGAAVAELFMNKEYTKISEYCIEDLKSTLEAFKLIYKYKN